MCGIAGIIKHHASGGRSGEAAPWHAPGKDFAALEAMSAALAHRGPDGSGIFTDPRPGKVAALVHRRLAVIDLPGGGQPMANEDAKVWVVFNGEIYNHAELRRELLAAGHTFKTDHSDTEVLVHGWEEWGTDLPGKLLGMFAFAVWDMREGNGLEGHTLFLARDRMGQKPLFYAALEDGLVFGSTIGSVLAWPEVPRRVPRELLALYLQLGYLPPPQTIYRDISQVMPGHWLRVRGEVMDGNRYWPGPSLTAGQGLGESLEHETPGAALRALLMRSVESQLVADVPIACFLSGGIDSSIIAALMQKAVLARGGESIHTVSVGFAESSFDETAYAQAVAGQIGSNHTRLEVRPDQNVVETLQLLMSACLGQPFADSSILPTYHLSKAVRQVATVALSGDGADELFAGYDRYRALLFLQQWSAVARFLPGSAPVGALARRERYRRLAQAAHGSGAWEKYSRLVEIFSPEALRALFGGAGPLDDALAEPAEGELARERLPLRMAMLRDQRSYLPGDVLWKVDSASMSPGQAGAGQADATMPALEVRSPFLDHRVVELAHSLEPALLLGGGRGKRILREEFAAELPAQVRRRPKKGFGVPVGTWFKQALRGPLNDLVRGPNSFCQAHLTRSAIEQLIAEHEQGTRDHTHRLFALFMLELWAKQAGTLDVA